MSIRQGNKIIAGQSTSGVDLFDFKWADHRLNDVSWLWADTFSWHSDDVYTAAYDHLAGELMLNVQLYAWLGAKDNTLYTYSETPQVGDPIVDGNGVQKGTIISVDGTSLTTTITSSNPFDRRATQDLELDLSKTDTIGDITITYYRAEDGHKICLPDQESNIVALYESTGVAWYYILDTENKQFKLPRTKWDFNGLRDSVGGYVAPGLPNITGTFSGSKTASGGRSGAFYKAGTVGGAYPSGTSTEGVVEGFSANLSNPTYQDGATVQPPATQMYLYFYVGNFEQSAVEQTAGINAETFNGKADRDLLNTADNVDIVVESQLPTAENNYTWYRKYKSGWVEQGCIGPVNVTVASGGSVNSFDLPVKMASNKYAVSAILNGTFGGTVIRVASGTTESVLKLSLASTAGVTSSALQWQVSGMAA